MPDEYDISIEAALLETTITRSHTAKIRLTTTNEGDEQDLSVSTGGCVLFNRASQGSSPAGLWLRRSEEMSQTERKDSRWIAENLPESPEGFGGYGCNKRTYEAGEAISTDYAILHDSRVSGYLPPGEYRFEGDVSVWPAASDSAGSVTPRTFTWGFSIALDYRD